MQKLAFISHYADDIGSYRLSDYCANLLIKCAMRPQDYMKFYTLSRMPLDKYNQPDGKHSDDLRAEAFGLLLEMRNEFIQHGREEIKKEISHLIENLEEAWRGHTAELDEPAIEIDKLISEYYRDEIPERARQRAQEVVESPSLLERVKNIQKHRLMRQQIYNRDPEINVDELALEIEEDPMSEFAMDSDHPRVIFDVDDSVEAVYHYLEIAIDAFKTIDEEVEAGIKKAHRVFQFDFWRGPYGGKLWAKISNAITMLINATKIGDLIVAIDHFIDLEHNTGALISDFPSGEKFFIQYLLESKVFDDESMNYPLKGAGPLQGLEGLRTTHDDMRGVSGRRGIHWEDVAKFVSKQIKKIMRNIFIKHLSQIKEQFPQEYFSGPTTPYGLADLIYGYGDERFVQFKDELIEAVGDIVYRITPIMTRWASGVYGVAIDEVEEEVYDLLENEQNFLLSEIYAKLADDIRLIIGELISQMKAVAIVTTGEEYDD